MPDDKPMTNVPMIVAVVILTAFMLVTTYVVLTAIDDLRIEQRQLQPCTEVQR